MSSCHASSARCDEKQRVVIGGEERRETVHCIHPVRGYETLFGFITSRRDGREGREEVRKLAGSEIWETYTGSGL